MAKSGSKVPTTAKGRPLDRSSTPKPNSKSPTLTLTPTQIRNARKRRSRQKRQQNSAQVRDPSQQYFSNPLRTPTVTRARKFFQGHSVKFPVRIGPTTGWRTVAKLAVRTLENQLVVGLFVPGTHTVLPLSTGGISAHHPSIDAAVCCVEQQARLLGVEAYDEQTGRGHLRYLCVQVERSTHQCQVTLVWAERPLRSEPPQSKGSHIRFDDDDDGSTPNTPRKKRRLSSKLQKLCDAVIKAGNTSTKSSSSTEFCLHSLWVHYNAQAKHSNSIYDFGNDEHDATNLWTQVYGKQFVEEKLSLKDGPTYDVVLRFSPHVFRQANLDGFAHIVGSIRRELKRRSKKPFKILELYGGVGTIGLHLGDLASGIVSSDANPHNPPCFDQTCSEIPCREKCSYLPQDASSVVSSLSLQKFDVVVVDPPRKGLDTEVVEALSNWLEGTLVYVSCGFDAFVRDHNVLTTSGWVLRSAEGHVLFPGADAIETLAFFEKMNS